MSHIQRCPCVQFFTKFLVAGKEHPCVLCYHGNQACFFCIASAFFYKHCKQIALAVRVILLYKVSEFLAHARRTHIRRIGYDHIIFFAHHFCNFNQRQKVIHIAFYKYVFKSGLVIFFPCCKIIFKGIIITLFYIYNRTVFFCVFESLNNVFSGRKRC